VSLFIGGGLLPAPAYSVSSDRATTSTYILLLR
jgi:hypothetical protein